MTDREKLIALLTDFGLAYKTSGLPNPDNWIAGNEIVLDSFQEGYGFLAHWKFDEDGKFVALGLWE